MKLVDLVGVHQAIKQEKVYTQEQLKLIHINFSILNSHVTVIYLRFIKNIYFHAVNRNTENNCIGFFQGKKLTIKLHLSESLTFQNLFKNRKLLPAEKFRNILAFDKESKTKLISSRWFY